MVAGKYKASGKIMGQLYEPDIFFEVNGDVLTGHMIVNGDTWKVLKGTVSGDEFSYMLEIPSPLGALTARVKGSINGDDIHFMVKNPLVKAPFEGSRTE